MNRACRNWLSFANLALFAVDTVASCSFYNKDSGLYEHWNCRHGTNCCIFYGEQACCEAQEPYMSSGYSAGETGDDMGVTYYDGSSFIHTLIRYFGSEPAVVVLGVLSLLFFLILCCLHCRQSEEQRREEAEELRMINEMILAHEAMAGESSHLSACYEQPAAPEYASRPGPSSEVTRLSIQQPPAYDSITKEPPPPYQP